MRFSQTTYPQTFQTFLSPYITHMIVCQTPLWGLYHTNNGLSNPRKINKFAPKRIKMFDNVLKYPRKGLFYIGSYTRVIWYVCSGSPAIF